MNFEMEFSEGFIKDIEKLYLKGNGKPMSIDMDYGSENLIINLSFDIVPKERKSEK